MEQSDNPSVVVCDAGPLIHLHELDSLDLLSDFSQVFVAETVWQETLRHQPKALTTDSAALVRLPDPPGSPSDLHLYNAFDLDPGERAALSLMRSYPHAIFLTDDTSARIAAQTSHYRVHGTIGVLLRSIRRKHRTSAEIISLLEELPTRSTLHITKSLLQEVLQAIREAHPQ